MKWLTVLTCPARKEYLAATIASIERAGGNEDFAGERVVFVDGAVDEDYGRTAPGWSIRTTSPRGETLGTKAAMVAVIRAAAEEGAERLLYLEDDIVLCGHAVDVMASVAIDDDLAFLSFCDIKNVAPLNGVTVCPGYDFEAPTGEGGHWGNQALVLPRRALRYFAGAVSLPDWEESRRASDILLGLALATSPAPWRHYGVYSPSLAQHVGARSLVNPRATVVGWGRDSLTFPGEGADALTLGSAARHDVIPHYRADARTRLQIRFRGGKAGENRVAAKEGCHRC